MRSVHYYLSKPKYRAIILMPPLIMFTISSIIGYAGIFIQYLEYSVLISACILTIGSLIIVWSDSVRDNKDETYIEN